MGAAASIEPEVFHQVKAEYESKKAEGVSDEALFESMKIFIEAKHEESRNAKAAASEEAAAAVEEAPAAAVEEAKPVEDDGAGAAAEAEAVPVEAEAEAVAAE